MLIIHRLLRPIKNYNRTNCRRSFTNVTNVLNSTASIEKKTAVSNNNLKKEIEDCNKSLSKNNLIQVHKFLENITFEHFKEEPNLVSKLAIISVKKKIFSRPFFEILNHDSHLLIPKLCPKYLSLLLSSIANSYNKYNDNILVGKCKGIKYNRINRYEKLILQSINYLDESSKNNFIDFTPLDLSLTLSSLVKLNTGKSTTIDISNGLNNWLNDLNIDKYPDNTCQSHHFGLIGLHSSKFSRSSEIIPKIFKHVKVKDITPSIAILLLGAMHRHGYTSIKLSFILINIALKDGNLWTREIVWLIKLLNLHYSYNLNHYIIDIIDLLKKHYDWMNITQLSSVTASLTQLGNKLSNIQPNNLNLPDIILKEITYISNLLYGNLSKTNYLDEKATLNLLTFISDGKNKLTHKIAKFLDKNYSKLIPLYTKRIIIHTVTNNKLVIMGYDMRTELLSRIDEFLPFELLKVIEDIELCDEFVERLQYNIYNNHNSNIKVIARLLSTAPRFTIPIPNLSELESNISPTIMVHLCLGIIVNVKLHTLMNMDFVNNTIKYCIDLPISKFYSIKSTARFIGFSSPPDLPDNLPLLLLVIYHSCVMYQMASQCHFYFRKLQISLNYDDGNLEDDREIFGRENEAQRNYSEIGNDIACGVVECLTKLSNKTLIVKRRHDVFHIDIILYQPFYNY
ncbi:hypothetical protein BMR1_01G02585 [Babesia microti strain RI]|uniref:Uncharacterized protein n=1 Tax=Babesia microti (strain RI) TaxID=1133968 RepID=I7I8A0_BABMR|nr:hypothetical protein BMR1_01G02585 [Babesia microti strain RI]CCF72973.1 hypothetical protein BMR1_01G02585 [Babesia microti strain RI]|eukprot:XP_012647582.1 hypothetical protein BMR1_01G02585 [Babesia microti strain RI]